MRWKLVDETPALFEDEGEVLDRRPGTGQFAGMEFLHVRARRIINEIPSAAQLPFQFTINAYRGCSHACSYCFARPTHAYLDMNIGDDFDKRIVVKINAAERLRAELRGRRWRGDHIAMGTNTDPYQRCEGKYRLTREIVEVLGQAANPFSILTKSPLIVRDLDVLTEAKSRTDVRTSFSIGTLDEEVWRISEPGTPHPRRRVDAVAKLNEAGIPCGVLIAPVLPLLSDGEKQLHAVVKACADAGATSITGFALHLRTGVRDHYFAWLEQVRPDLVERYRRMYPRTYAPADMRRRIADIIHRAARRYGVATHLDGPAAEPAVALPLPAHEQLVLG